uniref:Uncharacterized protein n=1 Tax=Arundo donax TaxID=35708 RepID=A0A0A8YB48_ARUDO
MAVFSFGSLTCCTLSHILLNCCLKFGPIEYLLNSLISCSHARMSTNR